MPSLKEIKNRLTSVNSTRKITSAMKMVASSKLHHAQQMIENMLPYETMLEHILKTFLASEADASTVFNVERPVKRVALVVYASNSSLCGGFNANVIRLLQHIVDEYSEKLGNVKQCIEIAREIGQKFVSGDVDRVEMIYHHFKSAGSQILTRKNFLPIDLTEELKRDRTRDLNSVVTSKEAQEYLKKNASTEEHKQEENVRPLNDNFLVEPDMNTVLSQLIPKYLHLMLYTALLDSIASEHAARMVAMQTATDNADEILRELNLQFNKSRQQAITNELLDIVGGSINN